jgi:hypothetical protein
MPLGGSTFPTTSPCFATGLLLEKGGTYRVRLTIPKNDPWLDDTLEAGPNGIYSDRLPPWMAVFVPVRRRLNQPWFKPMARIGAKGTDDYVLDPIPSIPEASAPPNPPAEISFESEIVARTTGELFLYVNDGIPLGLTGRIYGNNRGSALVSVREIVSRP